LLAVSAALVAGILFGVGPARAEKGPEARSSSFFRCDSRHDSLRAFARSDESIDVYNGVTWLAGAGVLSMGTNPSRRWTRENDFDAGIRDGLRIDSAQSRQDADSISDLALAFNVAVLPAAAIGTHFARTHDCVEAWDMFGDTFEAVSLAFFVAEAIKVVSGRERPFGNRCANSPPRDANCRDDDRNLSFVSGHATLAAAGAGVSCRFALERRAFGTSSAARIAPCALGIAGALVSGTLRVASDRHWGTDILVGFGVGALIGSFDTWGPFEWLRVEKRDGNGELEASGFVLPFAQEGRFGAQWTMTY
jgi:membrane-associated phospholipid phosphatase